ncbi:uncharacterized protein LOC115729083 [Rhodamnia argentea]|uniref:Uncharacterized protein LOC115729083 n=1 Tax=Rhodamnia argentea TaxID=178133 RepID=A0ABM3GZG8_9MYRT|nr:uncharacterized protein LOC115729083 [Rhodamnia argentea]
MATEILRPQDCLAKRIGASPAAYPRRRNCSYGNSCSNPRPNRKHHQHQQRKRSVTCQSEPTVSMRSNPEEAGPARPGGLAMRKVTILRRGEPLDAAIKDDAGSKREGGGPVVSGLGPGPELVREQVIGPELRSPGVAAEGKPVVYAGSAFAVSPEPSSLPLPSFSNKKKQVLLVDDSATRDLRRILRLDLL